MDLYERIIQIIDANIVFCLLPCILTLMLIKLFFKNKFKTDKALNIIRWFIIGYYLITLTYYIFRLLFSSEETAFGNRATGPYWWAYWMMMLCAMALPLTLLIKKLASKYLYVLLIAFCIKIGAYFERFVIIVTSIHRDYLPPTTSTNDAVLVIVYIVAVIFLQGFILALLLLGIVELIERSKSRLDSRKTEV